MLDSDWSPKACPFAGVDFSHKAKLSVFTRYLKLRLLLTFAGVLRENFARALVSLKCKQTIYQKKA